MTLKKVEEAVVTSNVLLTLSVSLYIYTHTHTQVCAIISYCTHLKMAEVLPKHVVYFYVNEVVLCVCFILLISHYSSFSYYLTSIVILFKPAELITRFVSNAVCYLCVSVSANAEASGL
jgi:hypothetical protein